MHPLNPSPIKPPTKNPQTKACIKRSPLPLADFFFEVPRGVCKQESCTWRRASAPLGFRAFRLGTTKIYQASPPIKTQDFVIMLWYPHQTLIFFGEIKVQQPKESASFVTPSSSSIPSCTGLSTSTDRNHQILLVVMIWVRSSNCAGLRVSTGRHHQILLLTILVWVCLSAGITGVLHTYYSLLYSIISPLLLSLRNL